MSGEGRNNSFSPDAEECSGHIIAKGDGQTILNESEKSNSDKVSGAGLHSRPEGQSPQQTGGDQASTDLQRQLRVAGRVAALSTRIIISADDHVEYALAACLISD